MNNQPKPTTYGRESQVRREGIGGSPDLTLAVNNYRNYLNRLLSRLKEPKNAQIDQKAIKKMVSETTRHLSAVLQIVRTSPNAVSFAHFLEIVKAYLIVQVCFLKKKVSVTELLPDGKETDEFLIFLKDFSLPEKQRNSLGELMTNLETQKESLETLIRPFFPKFREMIAASRQEITDVIRPKNGKDSNEGLPVIRHEPTRKSPLQPHPPTQIVTEFQTPSLNEDQQLQVEFEEPEAQPQIPPEVQKSAEGIEAHVVKLLDKKGFEVIKKLGEGGMGVVYLAKDKNLGEAPVAIKRILRGGIDEMEWNDLRGRFQREGDAMADLTRNYPRGFTTVYGSFEMEGDPCIIMKCEQGATEGVSDDALSAATTKGRRTFDFSKAQAFLELEGFIEGDADSTICIESVMHLLDLVMHSKIIKQNSNEYQLLSNIKRKNYRPKDELTKDELPKDILDSATALKKLLEKHFFPIPVAEVMKYIQISKLHEGVMDGDKLMKLESYLREFCGENFPREVFTKIWMVLYKDFLKTIRFMHEEGYINRDIKPSNLILTAAASDIFFGLLEDIMLMTPADKEVKKEKVEAVFESALEKMKALDTSDETEGIVKVIDLGLVKKIDGNEKSPAKKKTVKNTMPHDNAYRTEAGTMMGTPAYMTRHALMYADENSSPEADFHAAGLTGLALLKGEEVVKIGRNSIQISLNIDIWAEEADKARTAGALPVSTPSFVEKILKGKKNKSPVALSVAEKDPELFTYLVENHPVLAAWFQSATWLTQCKRTLEIDWDTPIDYMQKQLYPEQDSRKKVGIAVVIALGVAGLIGVIGYKVQSNRNAIEIQRRAVEEKLNSIRLRVQQTKDMPETSIEEMEVKLAACRDAIQFIDRQKAGTNSDSTSQNNLSEIDCEAFKKEISTAISSLKTKLVNALLSKLNEDTHLLNPLNYENSTEIYERSINNLAKLKEYLGNTVTNTVSLQIEDIEWRLNYFRLGYVFINDFERAMRIEESLLNENPEYRSLVNKTSVEASSFIEHFRIKESSANYSREFQIPAEKIQPSSNNFAIVGYIREISNMEFPQNFLFACEYLHRVDEQQRVRGYESERFVNLRNESVFKIARWLSKKIAESIYTDPKRILSSQELSQACLENVVEQSNYFHVLSEALESIDDPRLDMIKLEIKYAQMHLAYSYIMLKQDRF